MRSKHLYPIYLSKENMVLIASSRPKPTAQNIESFISHLKKGDAKLSSVTKDGKTRLYLKGLPRLEFLGNLYEAPGPDDEKLTYRIAPVTDDLATELREAIETHLEPELKKLTSTDHISNPVYPHGLYLRAVTSNNNETVFYKGNQKLDNYLDLPLSESYSYNVVCSLSPYFWTTLEGENKCGLTFFLESVKAIQVKPVKDPANGGKKRSSENDKEKKEKKTKHKLVQLDEEDPLNLF